MNPKKESIDKFLETYIPSPSSEEMEAIGARVLRRLNSERRNAPSGNSSSSSKGDSLMKVSRASWQPVAAAVLIAMVGVGLYAAQHNGFLSAIFFVQRESTPQVVLPTAQSSTALVKAAAETAQVTALTPGSTKPGAAPSREELLPGVAAQIAAAQSTDAGAARPKFAAASVRAVPMSQLVVNGFKCLGVDGLWVLVGGAPDPPAQGRCTGDVVNLSQLVYPAYSSSSSSWTPLSSIAGIPSRLAGLNFQIRAVADNPERVTKGELKLMLQTLLEDRFKARVHLETREVDGYVLTIGKSGIRFKEASGDPLGLPPGSQNHLNGKYRMDTLTTFMTLRLGYLPIADRTGLRGVYGIDFELEEIRFAPATGGPRAGGPRETRQFTTPLPKALEDQLGLHLERGKVPEEYVVIDHLEMPTEN